MPLHTVGSSYTDDAGSIPLVGMSYVVPAEINMVLPVPAGTVNGANVISFTVAKVHDYCLTVATQTAAQQLTGKYTVATSGTILLNVNSTGTPAPALTINAGVPMVFAPCIRQSTNEFTTNVTTFYLNNSGSTDLVLVVQIGLNI